MRLKILKPASLTIISLYCALTLSGCATSPYDAPPPIITGITPGVYHYVSKGDTLWRISKTYNMDLDELARINHIADAAKIEVDQKIFIPHRKKQISLPRSSKEDDFCWPINGSISSSFNQNYGNMINKGINIRPSAGADVVASRSGRVVFLNPDFKRYGKTIIIDHQDGYLTIYAGNSQIYVKIKDYVQKGQAIARLDPPGKLNNTYLHFEIRENDIQKNPLFYLP